MSRTLQEIPELFSLIFEKRGQGKGGSTIDRQELERRRQQRQEKAERREQRRKLLLRMGKRFCIAAAAVLVVFLGGRQLFSAIERSQTEKRLLDAAAQNAASMGDAVAAMTIPQPTPEPAQLADPLLVLVNNKTPLPDDWTVDLVPVTEDSQEMIDARAYDDLFAMTEAARKEGVWFWVTSGYRSVELQEDILERKIAENEGKGMTREEAEEDALRTIQRPGYSEHHTGLAVDFNDASDHFEETDCYYWLEEHAAEYGFVQRYKQDKADVTSIDNESWHYRYVGKLYAEEMERLDLSLEEYVEYLKTAQ